MKTKVLHKQQKNIDFNKNILNNQNYILWKTEKKKLLSKFFVESFIKTILLFFVKKDSIFEKENKLYSNIWGVMFIIYLFIFFYWLIVSNYILLFSFWILFLFLSYIIFSIIEVKKETISFREYFFVKGKFSFWFIFLSFISIFFWWIFMFYIGLFNYVAFYYIILFFLLIFLYEKWLSKIKITNLLSFPFIILIVFLNIIYSLIKSFLFKWIKWYFFTKTKPITNILSKFKYLNKNYAENKYYKIEQK